MTNQDLFSINLPQWPECRVSGDPVTKEEAAEIIIRTQDFYLSSNDKEFESYCPEEFNPNDDFIVFEKQAVKDAPKKAFDLIYLKK